MRPDTELDVQTLRSLLARVAAAIHTAPDRERYNMNGFLIAAGAYIAKIEARAALVPALFIDRHLQADRNIVFH